MHSCFTSSIFAARTLDFKVKFGFVFRSEAVVFRRYVLALLSVGLLRKFEAYLVYLSLIRSYFLRCFSFFQKFLHFTYMLLWFRLIIPSFPAQIDDMRSRFSALSAVRCTSDACALEARQRFVTERGKKKKKESRKLNPGLTAWVITMYFRSRTKSKRQNVLLISCDPRIH